MATWKKQLQDLAKSLKEDPEVDLAIKARFKERLDALSELGLGQAPLSKDAVRSLVLAAFKDFEFSLNIVYGAAYDPSSTVVGEATLKALQKWQITVFKRDQKFTAHYHEKEKAFRARAGEKSRLAEIE